MGLILCGGRREHRPGEGATAAEAETEAPKGGLQFQKPRGSCETHFPPELPKGTKPARALISDFQPPELREYISVVLSDPVYAALLEQCEETDVSVMLSSFGTKQVEVPRCEPQSALCSGSREGPSPPASSGKYFLCERLVLLVACLVLRVVLLSIDVLPPLLGGNQRL